MTGKQLKEWAAQVPDEAVIETREKSYSCWNEDFSLRATLQKEWDWQKEEAKQPERVLVPAPVPEPVEA